MNEPLAGRYTMAGLNEDLQQVRAAAGMPSMRRIVRESAKAADDPRYKDPKKEKLEPLTLTTLRSVLNGKRKSPPGWPWLMVYVLTCQRIMGKTPGYPEDPGSRTLPLWRRRLDAVHASEAAIAVEPAGQQAPPSAQSSSEGSQPSSGLSLADEEQACASDPPLTLRPPDACAATSPVPRESAVDVEDDLGDAAGDDEGSLPDLSEVRFAGRYGEAGRRLYRVVEDQRLPSAEYGLGVLLGLDDRPQESLFYLMRAAANGERRASKLIKSGRSRYAAMMHAYELGRHELANGDPATAWLFLYAAACAGHPEASFEFGMMCFRQQQRGMALEWFNYAAACGHLDAREWAKKMCETTHRRVVPPPSASPEWTAGVPALNRFLTQLPVQSGNHPTADPDTTPPWGLPAKR